MRIKKNFLVLLCLSLMLVVVVTGCRTSAQRKPVAPEQSPNMNQQKAPSTSMSASEQRILANRLSNLAEQVQGVKNASVVVYTSGVNKTNTTGINTRNMPSAGPTYSSYDTSTNRKMSKNINPNSNMLNVKANQNNMYPDINNVNNPNPLTDDNQRNMAAAIGVTAMVGLDVDASAQNDQARLNRIKAEVARRIKSSDNRISQVMVTTDPDLTRRISSMASQVIKGTSLKNMQNDINDLTRKLTAQP